MPRYSRGRPLGTTSIFTAPLTVPITGVLTLAFPAKQFTGAGTFPLTGQLALTFPAKQFAATGNPQANSVTGDLVLAFPTKQFVALGTAGLTIIPTGLYSSTDLLQRVKFKAQRPSSDTSMQDSDWYSLLLEAEIYWMTRIASVCPEALYGPPTMMTSTDGGYTYYFGFDANGNPIFPIGDVELRQTQAGRPWQPGVDWDQSADFIRNGAYIRFPGQRQRIYQNGPWARFITLPTMLDGSGNNEPVLLPIQARSLMVWRALILWARRAGTKDPQVFLDAEREEWFGNPAEGNHGILSMLRTQYALTGAESLYGQNGNWWSSIDSGLGYTRNP